VGTQEADEEGCKFNVSLDYIVRLSQNSNNQKKKGNATVSLDLQQLIEVSHPANLYTHQDLEKYIFIG
jgi:hypothetical protein